MVPCFSEKLRMQMETGLGGGKTGSIFPQAGRLKSELRKALDAAVFHGFSLKLDRMGGVQKRLVLQGGKGKRLAGSVDIDAALEAACPDATRWDYAIGYRINNRDDRAFFVEFHRAKTDEVPRVLRKKQWLENWMQGKPLANLQEREFVWVSAGGIRIPPNSRHRRVLNAHGLRLERRLHLG